MVQIIYKYNCVSHNKYAMKITTEMGKSVEKVENVIEQQHGRFAYDKGILLNRQISNIPWDRADYWLHNQLVFIVKLFKLFL